MEVTELAEATGDRDPGVGLRAVAALRALLEELEATHVSTARAQGWSWEQIADALGVRRQTVHRKHARRTKE
jgi:IS30 family transposase